MIFTMDTSKAASIVDILPDSEAGRLHLQAPVDLLANLLHNRSAENTDSFFVRQAVFHHFCRSSFGDNVRHAAGLPLALMGFHSDLFRCGRFGSI